MPCSLSHNMCLLASFHVTVAGALVVSTGWWPVTAPVAGPACCLCWLRARVCGRVPRCAWLWLCTCITLLLTSCSEFMWWLRGKKFKFKGGSRSKYVART